MKICVISTPVFRLGPMGLDGYGGLEQLAWQTARGLAAKGHAVKLMAPDGSECPGVEVIPVGPERQTPEDQAYGGFPEVKEKVKVQEDGKEVEKEVLRRRKHEGYWQHLLDTDCVVDHTWNKWSYILKREGRLKAPVLGVCHAPVNTMFSSPPPVDKPCIVCISRDQADHYEALFGRPGSTRVAHNGVDLGYYKQVEGVRRGARFLFLARFSSIKGPHISQQVCRECGVGLDLIGDTQITGEPEYYEMCRRAADGEQIRIIGGVSRGEAVWWFSRARALLHCNKTFREPFGLAPVEAMACGCPVVGFDHGAMRETVKHGETGFLVRSEREMVEVINSGALDRLDRGRCREWAAQFSLQRMVSRYDELVREAVDGGGW